MKQNNFSINIDNPCSKNWNELSKSGKDKFCASCTKKVVDFSTMKHNQIVDYVKGQKDQVCGRLTIDQMDSNSSIIINTNRFKTAFLSLVAITIGKNLHPSIINDNRTKQLIVQVEPIDSLESVIKGNIIDKNTGDPFPFVNVRIKGTKIGTTSDFDGNFSIDISSIQNKDSTILIFQFLGYQTKEVVITSNKPLAIEMVEDKRIMMGEIVVTKKSRRARLRRKKK